MRKASRSLGHRSFNGAAGIHRRKHTEPPRDPPESKLLQWGRRNSPAETSTTAPVCSLTVRLQWGRRNSPAETYNESMRPSGSRYPLQWGRRNSPAETADRRRVSPTRIESLQWGRRNSPAETATDQRGCRPTPRLLQWGRRNSPAETQVTRDRSRLASITLQWGRRNSPAETRSRALSSLPCSSCFNGAAGIHRRKPPIYPQAIHVARRASMGPPEFTGGNLM